MNTLSRAALLLLAFAAVVAAPPDAAVAKGKRGVSQYREIHPTRLGDGVYTIANRSVVCRVQGEAAACMTRWIVMVCRNYACHPKKEGDLKPAQQIVTWDDLKVPNVKILKPHRYVEMGQLTCAVGRNYVDCDLGDALGGFQLGDAFARSINWDETPSRTWPWDGRRYKARDAPFHQSDAPP
jgi:hypothetical protein